MTRKQTTTLGLRKDRIKALGSADLAQAGGAGTTILDWEYTCGTNFVKALPKLPLP